MKPDAIIIPYKLLSKWDCIIIKGGSVWGFWNRGA